MTIEPYLHFNGHADEAIAFYQKALGAKVEMVMRFKEAPVPTSPDAAEKVMHAAMRIGNTRVLLSDGCNTGTAKFEGIHLSLRVDTEAEAEKAFAALSEEGKVHMPLGKTFFTSSFGMVVDRFGIMWMVLVHH